MTVLNLNNDYINIMWTLMFIFNLLTFIMINNHAQSYNIIYTIILKYLKL